MARILVIEDEVDVTKVLKKRLSDRGYEVFIANDINEGVRLARDEKPDLIILDMLLPAGGGLSLLRSFKSSSETKDISVIVVTGVRNEVVKANALREGAEGFLEKPYDTEALMSMIKDVLEKRTQAR